jgi:hypothetical protein
MTCWLLRPGNVSSSKEAAGHVGVGFAGRWPTASRSSALQFEEEAYFSCTVAKSAPVKFIRL